MTNIFATDVAKSVESFFENYAGDTEVSTVVFVTDETTSRGGTVSYSQPAIGSYGIFSGIFKDAYLRVSYAEVNCIYNDVPRRALRVNVALHYKLANGGSNGNNICSMIYDLNGKYGTTLLEYQFDGQDAVFLEETTNV